MNDKQTISVVIITRNRAQWLEDALESLARQSRPADEVIVVDGSTTDATKKVVAGFQDRLKIRYIYEAKRGIPQARSTSIAAATGDIVASLDDDCEADVDWLKNLEIPFIKDPHIGAVGGQISYVKLSDSHLEAFYIENMLVRRRKGN
jgi:glucosyl-dolichyl phosphate glucuronosyltransferase